jgi:hypothetical protein
MQDDSAAKVRRKPDSLLFSLKELRHIEDTRISQEEENRRLEAEQRRLEAEEEARRAEEEEERIQRERLEQERAHQQREEMLRREERLRVAEAERRARVEAEMALERERLKLEISARPPQRQSPWSGVTIGVAVLLAGACALLGYELHEKVDEVALARQKRDHYARLETRTTSELQQTRSELKGNRRQIQRLEERIRSLTRRAERAEAAATARPKRQRRIRGSKTRKIDKTIRLCDPKDPMCGGLDYGVRTGRRGKRTRRR